MKVLLLNASPKTTGATQWIADAVKAALPDGTETTSRSMADAEFALCIGCKRCEKDCPGGAITVIDNLAVIDYEKCTRCGQCVKNCPTACLKIVFFPNLPEGLNPEDLLSY